MKQPPTQRKAANVFLAQIALDNALGSVRAAINNSGHAHNIDLGVGEFLHMFITSHLLGKGLPDIGWGPGWYDMNDDFVALADALLQAKP